MKKHLGFLFTAIPLAFCLACKGPPPPHDTAAPVGTAVQAAMNLHGDCPHKHGHDSTPIGHPTAQTVKNAAGEEVVLAGAKLVEADQVSVSDLLTKAAGLKGKRVQIEGNVAAMCHHRRGWFALVGDDTSGQFVRVLTAPAFLVPAGSIGKRARTQGTVDVVEVDVQAAQHYAAQHKLGDPKDITSPVQQVVLRATGAEFL